MKLCMAPDLYELVGDETGSGTALAVLIARQVKGPVCWIATPTDYAPSIFNFLDWLPDREFMATEVGPALALVRAVDDSPGVASLIVLDSLAGLRGSHPQARTIANDVRRGIAGWEPKHPILVVNQRRDPAPPGGLYWRRRVNSRALIPLWDRPIVSLLGDYVPNVPPGFFVWYSQHAPEFRPLRRLEWAALFPDGIPGYTFGENANGDRLLIPDVIERRRPWLIDRTEEDSKPCLP